MPYPGYIFSSVPCPFYQRDGYYVNRRNCTLQRSNIRPLQIWVLPQYCSSHGLPHPLASHMHARSLSVAAAAYLPTSDLSQNSWHSRLVNSKDGRMGQGYWAQMTKRKMARDADYCMPVKVCCLCFPRESRKMQTLGSYDKICRSWTQKDISVMCGVLLVKTMRHCSPCGE